MEISLKKIIEAEAKVAVEYARGLLKDRRTKEHLANTAFHSGNHFQNGDGWIGERPTVAVVGVLMAMQEMEKIRQGFVSENVIAQINNRHAGGILGREVNWDCVSDDLFWLRRDKRKRRKDLPEKDATAKQADKDLTGWWNEDRPKDKLKEGLVIALNEEKALLRYFIPRGLRDDKGTIPKQSSVPDALGFLHVDVVYSDKGGVFTDTDTQQKFGLYVKTEGDKTTSATVVEVSWVDKGITFLQIISDDAALSQDGFSCDLGGRLWHYELRRDPLITEQVRSGQKSLNLAKTMMMRNVNLAGSRERYFFNVERPTETIRIKDDTQPLGYREEKRPLPGLPVGAGVSMGLRGELIEDKEGKVIDRADPNVSITDPVEVTTFVNTIDQNYAGMLRDCQQIHVLISGDATASGRSREQARAEFEGSLRLSKEVVDDAGRWMLETGLRLAAHLCDQTATYAGLRCDFNAIIETGPISPEERRANREDMKDKVLSRESVMSRNGTEDVDAEKARIAEDEAEAPDPIVPPNPKPANGDSQLIQ